MVKFMESLHNGDMDTVISDMVKYTNFKTLSYTAKLSLETFGLDVVIEQYKLQRHQAAQPVTPQPSSNARLPLLVDDDASYEVPAMPDSTKDPALELKHSVFRVARVNPKRRRSGATSNLLPSSRLMLLPPLVPEARYSTGCEGLAVQGIDHSFTTADPVLSDGEYLHLASNAFCGGSCGLIFMALVSFLDLDGLPFHHSLIPPSP